MTAQTKASVASHIISLLIAAITTMSFGYGFYFSTTNTLSNHAKDIIEVKTEVDVLKVQVSNSVVSGGAFKEQIKYLDARVTRIETTMDRIEDKIDKVIIQTRN